MQVGSVATSYAGEYVGAGQSRRGGRPPEMSEEMQQKIFQEADADGNGSVSEAEFAAFREAMQKRMEERRAEAGEAGTDGVAPPEASQETEEALFAELDADGDGELSESEFASMGKMGPPPGPPPGGPVGASRETDMQSFLNDVLEALAQQTDEDGDGTLSETESESLREKLEALLQNSTYGVDGAMNVDAQSLSGTFLNYLS